MILHRLRARWHTSVGVLGHSRFFSSLGPRWQAERKFVEEHRIQFMPAAVDKVLQFFPKFVLSRLSTMAPTLDLPDARLLGENPYTFNTIVEDEIWTVFYNYQTEPVFVKAMKEFASDSNQDLILGRQVCKDNPGLQDLLKEDFQVLLGLQKMSKDDIAKGGLLKVGRMIPNCMTIARMQCGGLLLYNPVLIDDEAKVWVEKLGRVKFIVSPNAAHTLFSHSATKAFPDAKYIASTVASQKVAKVGVKTDFDYTNRFSEVQKLLSEDFDTFVPFDRVTDEIILLHKKSATLLTCDLFGAHDDIEKMDMDTLKAVGPYMRVFLLRMMWPQLGGGWLPFYRYTYLYPHAFPSVMSQANAGSANPAAEFGADLQKILDRQDWSRAIHGHKGTAFERKDAQSRLEESWQFALEEARASTSTSQ